MTARRSGSGSGSGSGGPGDRTRARVAGSVLALAAWAPAPSLACGACVEDKVAATYDHSAVVRAATNGNVTVFCDVIGRVEARHLRAAVRQVRGVDARSVRVSVQPAALSFAVDPAAGSPQAAVDAVQRALPATARLKIVRLLAPQRRVERAGPVRVVKPLE